MNLSAPFIQRPVMTTLLMLCILFLGILSYFQLPVSNLPDINFPVINVKVSYPGASPDTMANAVATPLEKEFMTIPGIANIASTNTLGNTSIVLQFNINKNIDTAAQEVETGISRSAVNLPSDLPNPPTLRKINPAMVPIMYVALSSKTAKSSELYTFASTFIGQRLSMIDGVAQVTTFGSPYAVRVQVDPHRLAILGITLKDVASALQQGNPNYPTGKLDGQNLSSTIKAKGQLTNAAMFEPLIVTYRNEAPVRIRDIGKAIDGLKDDRMSLRFVNSEVNEHAVVLAIQRQPNANTVNVAKAIKAILPGLKEQLPASIHMNIIFDQSISIEESVHDVQWTLFFALILVVLVIFLYLGKVRDTIIPSLVLPMSLIGTFIAMYLLNYSLDTLSLLALTLAIGFVIDDAIVVLENIVRKVEEGDTPRIAALKGSKQICFTVLSMTISLVAVFIPILFMGGLLGKIFQEFAITLAIVTLASGIISLTLTPMLCSRFIPPKSQSPSGIFTAISNLLNQKLMAFYAPLLRFVLRHRKSTLLLGAFSVILSLFFFKVLPKDFIPDEDIGFIIAYNQAQQGTSSERMARYQNEVIQVLQKDPNINNFVSIASHTQTRDGVNFIRLKPRCSRVCSKHIIQNLYNQLGQIPGVNTFFKNVPLIDLSAGTQTRGSYQYALQSLNSDELYASAEELLKKMQDSPIFQGVVSDLEIKMPQLAIDILRDQASSLGISADNIEQALLLAYTGNRVSKIDTPIDQYDVILELPKKHQGNVESLSSIFVRSDTTKALTPLHAVAKWHEKLGPSSVNHIAQLPAVTINFNIVPGTPLGEALKHLDQLAKETLPPTVIGNVQGAAKTFKETARSLGFLLILAIFAIYVVLGILYESFIHPLTILSTLPPAILGGLMTLYFAGMPLSLYAFLGLILLIGIVKKNGIMMVDYALDNIREKKETPENAIFNACMVRFRPIMMTTIAAIAGALPIALGIGPAAETRRPLGFVIIGGLLFSQVVTLFLTPVIYLFLDRFRRNS